MRGVVKGARGGSKCNRWCKLDDREHVQGKRQIRIKKDVRCIRCVKVTIRKAQRIRKWWATGEGGGHCG